MRRDGINELIKIHVIGIMIYNMYYIRFLVV